MLNCLANVNMPAALSHETWHDFIRDISEKLDEHESELHHRLFDIAAENSVPAQCIPLTIPVGSWSVDGHIIPSCLFPGVTNGVTFRPRSSDERKAAVICIEEAAFRCLVASGASAKVIVVDCWKLGSTFTKLAENRSVAQIEILSDPVTSRDKLRSLVANYRDVATRGAINSIQALTVLILVDFPHGLDAQSLDDLILIANNANEAKFLIFSVESDQPADSVEKKKIQSYRSLIDFGFYDAENDTSWWKLADPIRLHRFLPFEIRSEHVHFGPAEGRDIEASVSTLRAWAASRLGFSVGHSYGLSVEIGRRNGGAEHRLVFGAADDVFHAMIGGQSGRGKSTLLDTIIGRSLTAYSSDELRFFVIDCGGTGFRAFDDATSVQFIVRTSNVEKCVDAAKLLQSELDRRESLLRDSGCRDIGEYVGEGTRSLPRIVCVIDEFHILYTGKEQHSVFFDRLFIERIARVGRKFGVHLIASTQTLGAGVRRSFLDNIPLRIALGMTEEQSQGFLSLGNRGAANLPRGRAVYNPGNGARIANLEFDVDLLTPADLKLIVTQSNARNAACDSFEIVRI